MGDAALPRSTTNLRRVNPSFTASSFFPHAVGFLAGGHGRGVHTWELVSWRGHGLLRLGHLNSRVLASPSARRTPEQPLPRLGKLRGQEDPAEPLARGGRWGAGFPIGPAHPAGLRSLSSPGTRAEGRVRGFKYLADPHGCPRLPLLSESGPGARCPGGWDLGPGSLSPWSWRARLAQHGGSRGSEPSSRRGPGHTPDRATASSPAGLTSCPQLHSWVYLGR